MMIIGRFHGTTENHLNGAHPLSLSGGQGHCQLKCTGR